ncbi:MAG: CocE/NonD family hydrolase [Leifsonia sp.]
MTTLSPSDKTPTTTPTRPHSVVVERGVRSVMRDGVSLEADVYRPDGDGSYPVAVMRLPYGRSVWEAQSVPDPRHLAAAGYIVVVQDVRGRYGSEGRFDSPGQEVPDGVDTLAWAATIRGSNGVVGTFGPSYLAQVQWAAAMEQPEALRSMITMVSPSDSLFDGFAFRGGAIELGSRLTWAAGAIGPDAIARREDLDTAGREQLTAEMMHRLLSGEYFRTRPLSRLAEDPTFVGEAVADWNASPEQLAGAPTLTRGRYGDIVVPVFLIGGWFDAFLGSTLAQYQGLRRAGGSDPLHLVVGPWSHMEAGSVLGDVDFGLTAAHDDMGDDIPLADQNIRWFDATLGDDSAALSGIDPVRLFIMGENRWESFGTFPPPARPVDLFFGPGGTLSVTPPATEDGVTYVYDPADPAPTLGGATLMLEHRPGPVDQRPLYARDDVIGFQGESLSRATTVVGYIEVELFAETSAVDTDFIVRLCDVHPTGESMLVADGIIRASARDSYDRTGWVGPHPARAVEPWRTERYEFNLWATAHTFLPGHRIRVDVTSSSFPRWDPNVNSGEPAFLATVGTPASQTVWTGADRASRIRLPLLHRP